MKFVILAVLIILVIAFFVVVYKAAIHWRWYQIVAACFTMIFAVAWLFPTAGVLQSRSAWHQKKEQLEVRFESSDVEQKRIKYGNPGDPTAGEGVVTLSQRLAKVGVEAGRRWRSLRMQNADQNAITLAQPPPVVPPGDGDDAARPTVPLVPESMVVYGFAEGQVAGIDSPIPVFYLGEFKVTASTPNQVTLAPTAALEQAQVEAIAQNKARNWSLYELLPLDGHSPFVAAGSTPDNDNLFGRIDGDLVRQTLQAAARSMGEAGANPEVLANLQQRRTATLESYLRSGTQSEQDDPPISRWVKIEFLKNHRIEVDSEDERGALDGGFFDGSGRAVDTRLQRSDDRFVQFRTGDQITVMEEYADQLIDEAIAKPINRYFVRPLNDYRFVLRRIRLRLAELTNQQKELEFERQVLEDAIAATDNMTTSAQSEKLKLEQDLEQSTQETAALTDYVAKLQANVAETRKNLMELYQSNQQLVERLQLIDRSITSRYEGLTAAVQ